MTHAQADEQAVLGTAIETVSDWYGWSADQEARFRNALFEGLAHLSPSRGFHTATRGQGTNLAGLFMGILIAAIIGVAVVIPVILNVVNNSSASGNTLTILQLLPLFVALLLLVALAGPVMRRV